MTTMQVAQRSTCPSCGRETLETQGRGNLNHFETVVFHGEARFECNFCQWQGSTASLNMF